MPTAFSRLPKTTASVISDRLRCVADPFGAVHLVAASQQVLLDSQARDFGTTGRLSERHAAGSISLRKLSLAQRNWLERWLTSESLPPSAAASAWSGPIKGRHGQPRVGLPVAPLRRFGRKQPSRRSPDTGQGCRA